MTTNTNEVTEQEVALAARTNNRLCYTYGKNSQDAMRQTLEQFLQSRSATSDARSINYAPIYEYATAVGVSYTQLCSVVLAAHKAQKD